MNDVSHLGVQWPLPRFGTPQVRELMEKQLLEPASEYLTRPSKAVRKQLVFEGYRLAREIEKNLEPAPSSDFVLKQLSCAIEMIHAGSLILDDIQDHSEKRRGRPAYHIEHGASAAITMGSWLLIWPLRVVCDLGLEPICSQKLQELFVKTVSDAHYGQMIDVSTRIEMLPMEHVPVIAEFVARSKTGRLTGCALAAGAILSGASSETIAAIECLGEELGVLLQRLDDLGNCFGSRAAEKRYEDLINGRVTWIWAWVAKNRASEYPQLLKLVKKLPEEASDFLNYVQESKVKLGAQETALDEYRASLARFQGQTKLSAGDGLNQVVDGLIEAFLG